MVKSKDCLSQQPEKTLKSNVKSQLQPIWIFDDVSGVSDWLTVEDLNWPFEILVVI